MGFLGLFPGEGQLGGEALIALEPEPIKFFVERVSVLCLGGLFGRAQSRLALFLGLRFDGGQFFGPRLLGFDPDPFDLLGQSFLRFDANPRQLGLEFARLGFRSDSSLVGGLSTQTLGLGLSLGHLFSMKRS